VSKIQLVLRVPLDCAYLVRSHLTWHQKVRILLEYARLTAMVVVPGLASRRNTDRVLGYRVTHFGIGSLQFLFREIFVRGEYVFGSSVRRPLIFDCGANIGMATLFFKWLHPDSEVHAFEPDPIAFETLKTNVERNHLSNVHLHNVALCDACTPMDFFVPMGAAASPMMSLVAGRVPGARRISVPARRLSTFVDGREIEFMKVDVEGSEDAVFRELGSSGALRRVRQMAIEYHHNLQGQRSALGAFLEQLSACGFQYQLDVTWGGSASLDGFQDILVRARQ
jgi:FkbM family methyltransferase